MFVTLGLPLTLAPPRSACQTAPRLKSFPRGTGRAHDTGLLCKWLEHELQLLGDEDVANWILYKCNLFLWVFFLWGFLVKPKPRASTK